MYHFKVLPELAWAVFVAVAVAVATDLTVVTPDALGDGRAWGAGLIAGATRAAAAAVLAFFGPHGAPGE